MTDRTIAAAIAALTLLGAAQAQAHAKLVTSDPADGAAVSAPSQIVLRFSERLQPKFSTARLVTPATNDTPVAAKAAVAADGKTMTITPAKPLVAGAYVVQWRAVAADTHKMEGKVSFTVR